MPDPSDGLVLAVSGGADSVALLHGTLQLWPGTANVITVVHMNHGLRGKDSDADAAFVRNLAADLEMPFAEKAVPAGHLQEISRGSLEEAARKSRYEFLLQTAEEQGRRRVVVAHHQQDQAETMLHHLIRGTGISGLVGMSVERPLSETVSLIRPMLRIQRDVIHDYLREIGVRFCTDLSNADSAMTRNRIRHRLLPMMEQDFHPHVVQHLGMLSGQVSQLVSALNAFGDSVLQRVLLEQTRDCCRLQTAWLREYPDELVAHFLIQLWRKQNWPRRDMTAQHWARLTAAIRSQGKTRFQLPGPVDVVRQGDLLRLFRVTDASDASECRL
ncbi:MAG: tRNA lysidine(34) synthetase TilS [Planctomycetaceae bacterium]